MGGDFSIIFRFLSAVFSGAITLTSRDLCRLSRTTLPTHNVFRSKTDDIQRSSLLHSTGYIEDYYIEEIDNYPAEA